MKKPDKPLYDVTIATIYKSKNAPTPREGRWHWRLRDAVTDAIVAESHKGFLTRLECIANLRRTCQVGEHAAIGFKANKSQGSFTLKTPIK
jgi:hypothetical protein